MSSAIPIIKTFMSPDPAGVDCELTVADAADRMRANNIRHLLVVRKDQLRGVISLDDVSSAIAVAGDQGASIPVAAITRLAFTCRPETSMTVVSRHMEANHLDCAVVVEDGDVVGIFTVSDALRCLRALAAGHDVAPAVTSTLHPAPEEAGHEHPLSHVRVKRMLRSHGAAPSPNDGAAFGTVFTR
jgi:CBS domain-containing protein